ncbi:hypothetical protein DPMN_150206 [Dreissena polymorpha]|uniref:Uncharacterized protein n=1 Tax=Dreissena polymorpha TaxID=45954 RepID=A0A9D4FIW2_DREPO|nr:hypothetical protein DPMN_150206 [Dreissena polymorpha]
MDSNNEVIKGMLENTEIPFDTFTTFQQKCLQQPHLLSVVNLCNVVGKLEEAILDILKTLVLTDGFHFTYDANTQTHKQTNKPTDRSKKYVSHYTSGDIKAKTSSQRVKSMICIENKHTHGWGGGGGCGCVVGAGCG